MLTYEQTIELLAARMNAAYLNGIANIWSEVDPWLVAEIYSRSGKDVHTDINNIRIPKLY